MDDGWWKNALTAFSFFSLFLLCSNIPSNWNHKPFVNFTKNCGQSSSNFTKKKIRKAKSCAVCVKCSNTFLYRTSVKTEKGLYVCLEEVFIFPMEMHPTDKWSIMHMGKLIASKCIIETVSEICHHATFQLKNLTFSRLFCVLTKF